MAYFHEGSFDLAGQALDAAQATSEGRAEYHLYRGLLLANTAPRRAGAAFDRARGISADAVEPTASYFAGIAWAQAEEVELAKEAFRRVERDHPDTPWAASAATARRQLDAEVPPDWWVYLRAGFEYDDNVVLRGSGTQLPSEIGGVHDVRWVWQLTGGYELFANADWAAGLTATYYGSAHHDLNQFNIHYPTIGLWLDRRLAEATTLRFRYDFGYAWVDSDPFLVSHEFTPQIFHDWGREGRSRVFVNVQKYDYLVDGVDDVPDGPGRNFAPCLSARDIVCAPPGIDESRARNRDGWGWIAGVEHTFPLGRLETELTTAYWFHRYSSRGSELSYKGHEFRVETQTLLPWALQLRSLVSYTYKPYRNNSVFRTRTTCSSTASTRSRASGGVKTSGCSRWSWRSSSRPRSPPCSATATSRTTRTSRSTTTTREITGSTSPIASSRDSRPKEVSPMHRSLRAMLAFSGLALAASPATSAGEGALGQVVSLSGNVYVEAPDGGQRPLACDGTIQAGDVVITSPGAGSASSPTTSTPSSIPRPASR